MSPHSKYDGSGVLGVPEVLKGLASSLSALLKSICHIIQNPGYANEWFMGKGALEDEDDEHSCPAQDLDWMFQLQPHS